ncbi:unnamed protein product [Phyllotreta striolata]|uniref:Uncharacterized protein n=1 Tax=Phyllotreta striolata TaxID=444603 RepID=A0A9N9TLI0_PHYSR|nr:unnamed protein product [Phyllotreta striolata]
MKITNRYSLCVLRCDCISTRNDDKIGCFDHC